MNIAMKALLIAEWITAGKIDMHGTLALNHPVANTEMCYGNVRDFMPILAAERLGRAASPLGHRNILCDLNLGRLSCGGFGKSR
jgi:hypothetical protein